MLDKTLLLELFDEIDEGVRRIERRFAGIGAPLDFKNSDDGIDRLEAISMTLIAIGENIKRIDKITEGKMLERYPEIHWSAVKGIKDVLAHDYFNIDAEEIYNICSNDLGPLKNTIRNLRKEIL